METLQERHGIVSAGDVRRILNTDNSEIKDLCKQLKVYPKKVIFTQYLKEKQVSHFLILRKF